MNSKIGIVIEREYRARVMKKSFIIMTLLMPLIMVGLMFVPALIMSNTSDEQTVAVIDRTGLYGGLLQSTEDYNFTYVDMSMQEIRGDSSEGHFSAFLEIRQDLLEDPKAFTLYSHKTLPVGLSSHINRVISDYLSEQRLNSYQVDNIQEIIRDSKVQVEVPTYRIGEDGAETASNGAVASVIGMVMAMVLYFFISIYGGMVLQGVLEEKKSRIMEVMVSSVRPFDLLTGKLIGIGLVALTQMIVWVVILFATSIGLQYFVFGDLYAEVAQNQAAMQELQASDMSTYVEIFSGLAQINFLEVGILFAFYFVGGYLLYASLYAALGSAVSSDEDAQGFILPVTMVLLVSFYIGMACFDNPYGTLAMWASYIPFTSPIVMLSRAAYGVAWWEEVLSLVVLYGSFALMMFFSAKIYRIGVLMYGKKPSFKDLWKWLRHY